MYLSIYPVSISWPIRRDEKSLLSRPAPLVFRITSPLTFSRTWAQQWPPLRYSTHLSITAEVFQSANQYALMMLSIEDSPFSSCLCFPVKTSGLLFCSQPISIVLLSLPLTQTVSIKVTKGHQLAKYNCHCSIIFLILSVAHDSLSLLCLGILSSRLPWHTLLLDLRLRSLAPSPQVVLSNLTA